MPCGLEINQTAEPFPKSWSPKMKWLFQAPKFWAVIDKRNKNLLLKFRVSLYRNEVLFIHLFIQQHLSRVHYISDGTGLSPQGSSNRVLAFPCFSLKVLSLTIQEVRSPFLHFHFIYFKYTEHLSCSRHCIKCQWSNGDWNNIVYVLMRLIYNGEIQKQKNRQTKTFFPVYKIGP